MNLPDVVIPVRNGDNPELRYALRSLVNIPHGDVIVLGNGPRWYRGPRLPVTQDGHKTAVTVRAAHVAVGSRDVSDPFIYTNDDIYALHPGDIPGLEHVGTIDHVLAYYADRDNLTPARSPWLAGMVGARTLLRTRYGIEHPLCFELHVPITFDKTLLAEALRTGSRYFRTIYGNLALQRQYGTVTALLGDHRPHDVKLYPEDPVTDAVLEHRWLSTGDEWFGNVQPLLDRLFPHPHPYEEPTP